jgi:hypothetical protein
VYRFICKFSGAQRAENGSIDESWTNFARVEEDPYLSARALWDGLEDHIGQM